MDLPIRKTRVAPMASEVTMKRTARDRQEHLDRLTGPEEGDGGPANVDPRWTGTLNKYIIRRGIQRRKKKKKKRKCFEREKRKARDTIQE